MKKIIKKMLEELEIKKFNKLVKEGKAIPVTNGDELWYLLGTNNKEYYPKYNNGLVVF